MGGTVRAMRCTMNDAYDTIIALWVADPSFRTALQSDAAAACAAAGLHISSEELAVVRQSGVVDATDGALAPRLSRAPTTLDGQC